MSTQLKAQSVAFPFIYHRIAMMPPLFFSIKLKKKKKRKSVFFFLFPFVLPTSFFSLLFAFESFFCSFVFSFYISLCLLSTLFGYAVNVLSTFLSLSSLPTTPRSRLKLNSATALFFSFE